MFYLVDIYAKVEKTFFIVCKTKYEYLKKKDNDLKKKRHGFFIPRP